MTTRYADTKSRIRSNACIYLCVVGGVTLIFHVVYLTGPGYNAHSAHRRYQVRIAAARMGGAWCVFDLQCKHCACVCGGLIAMLTGGYLCSYGDNIRICVDCEPHSRLKDVSFCSTDPGGNVATVPGLHARHAPPPAPDPRTHIIFDLMRMLKKLVSAPEDGSSLFVQRISNMQLVKAFVHKYADNTVRLKGGVNP